MKKYLFNGIISSIMMLSVSALLFFAFFIFGNSASEGSRYVFIICSFVIMLLAMFLTGRYILKDLGANFKNVFSIICVPILIIFLMVLFGGEYTMIFMFSSILFTIIAPPSVLDNNILCVMISIVSLLTMVLFIGIGLAMKRKKHLEN